MDNIKDLQGSLAKLKKHLSLRQIAIQSGMNYITLHHILSGKTTKVTSGVADRLNSFASSFDPNKATPVLKKRGRKPGVKNAAPAKPAPAASAAAKKAPAQKAAAKIAPKPAVAAAAPPAKPVVAAAPMKKRGRKPGSKNRPKTAPVAVAAPKTRAKRGRKAGRPAKAPAAAPAATTPFTPMVLGAKLHEEIVMVQARLSYLKALEQAEATYMAALRKK